MTGLITVVDVSLGVLGLYLLKSLLSSEDGKNLPPGPKPRFLIGNLLELPTKGQDWLHWAKHKALYGPISSINVFGQTMVIINDAQIALDLFEKRSSLYSDRPTLVFGGEMCGWDQSLALQHYNDRFRAYRKHIHQVIGTRNSMAEFLPLEDLETRRFIARVAEQPEKLNAHIRKLAGAIILKIAYGYTIEPNTDDPLVDLADETIDQFSLSTTPGNWLVDVIPALRHLPDWMPGAGFKRTAKRWRTKLVEITERPHAFVKNQMAKGEAVPSYTSRLLEKISDDADGEQEYVVKYSAMSLYGGGADTTVSAIYGFYLAMTLYPEIQKKAQAELDAVVGNDRLPSISDRPNLPYIEALLQEVLRWNPVAPMGVPHVNIEDDVYQGYFIPKGAILLPNIWQMTHDPASYHDPMTFKPERFLGVDGHAPEQDTHNLAFGFGRRICPGKELADVSVFLAISMSLAAFNIQKARDASGAEIVPEVFMQSGVISHPKAFKCSVNLRSEKAAALVRAVHEEHPHPQTGDGAELSQVKWEAN